MWDVEHKISLNIPLLQMNDFIAEFLKRFNCYLVFQKIYLFLWQHFEINSVLLFNKFFLYLFLLSTSPLNRGRIFLSGICIFRQKLWCCFLRWSWCLSLIVSRCVLKVLSLACDVNGEMNLFSYCTKIFWKSVDG